jgi:DNA-binding NtrC family response regulator
MAPFLNAEIVPLSEVPDIEFSANALKHENRNVEPVVLVVDDEPLVADSLAAILKLAGYTAVTAYSGLSALGLAISLRPALVISDVAMPQMNGVELAIAVLKQSPDCSVLLFSGHATVKDLAPAREAGYDLTLLSKPLHPEEMLKHVSKNLRNAKRSKTVGHLGSNIATGVLAEST